MKDGDRIDTFFGGEWMNKVLKPKFFDFQNFNHDLFVEKDTSTTELNALNTLGETTPTTAMLLTPFNKRKLLNQNGNDSPNKKKDTTSKLNKSSNSTSTSKLISSSATSPIVN